MLRAVNSSHVLVLADVLHVENNATGTLGGNLVNRSILRWSGTRGFMDSTSGKELPQTFPVKQMPRIVARREQLRTSGRGVRRREAS